MIWPLISPTPRIPFLKAYGTATHTSSQVTSASLDAANVKAGGIVFCWAREPDNQTAFAAPSGGWTLVSDYYGQSRGMALYYKLTSISETVTATFAAGKIISIFAMHCEDEQSQPMSISGLQFVEKNANVFTIGGDGILSDRTLSNADDIFSMMLGYSGDPSFNLTASVSIVQACTSLVVGDGVRGAVVSDRRLIDPDAGASHTWSANGLSGAILYFHINTFRLTV